MTVHPYLIHSGHIYLPTFGALAAVGLMLALTLSLETAARAGLSPDRVWEAGLFAVIAAFVLSRLLLIATNFQSFLRYPMLLIAVPSLTPLGFLLTAIATGVWLWMHRLPLLTTLDAWAPCATLTWAFLSLGHFFAGSDPGMIAGSRIGVTMPGMSVLEEPVAIFACVAALAITPALIRSLGRRTAQGDTFVRALAAVGMLQFILCFLRLPGLDDAGPLAVLDPLQWVSLAMIVAAAVVYLQPRPTGSAAAQAQEKAA